MGMKKNKRLILFVGTFSLETACKTFDTSKVEVKKMPTFDCVEESSRLVEKFYNPIKRGKGKGDRRKFKAQFINRVR